MHLKRLGKMAFYEDRGIEETFNFLEPGDDGGMVVEGGFGCFEIKSLLTSITSITSNVLILLRNPIRGYIFNLDKRI
jgi:hypothetical protein